MDMGSTEKKFVIDLSDIKNTAQLAGELSNILDSSNNEPTDVVLNLGDLSLKQSQLLSIKALIESIDSKLDAIYTTSEMTEASAISLNITIRSNEQEEAVEEKVEETFQDAISNHIEDLNDTFSTVNEQEQVSEIVEEVVEAHEEIKNNIETIEEIAIKEEKSEEDILSNPDVKSALNKALGIEEAENNNAIETNFNLLRPRDTNYEETETTEKSSEGKYVLLDTEGITPEDLEESEDKTTELPTLYLYQTLRSGQTINHEGNVLIIGDAHPGSEIIATGDVTVWGIIGGIVHAGSKGNVSAKVRALKLNPIQLRIAGLYSRRNDTVNVPYIQRSNEFTPEEARIENKQIVVYKTLRRED